MKRLILGLVGLVSMWLRARKMKDLKSEFTGNETVYPLQQGSDYAVRWYSNVQGENGWISTVVVVALSGTEGNIEHPVHLHLGNISAPGADVAALLNPVLGKSGISETYLTSCPMRPPVTYKQLD